MIFVNSIGLGLQSIYLTWFFLFTKNKSQINRVIIILLFILFFIHLYTRYSSQPESLIALIASLSSLIFCASPLASVSEVFRTKSTEKLPFALILSSFVVSSLWFLYGFMLGNIYVQLPNGIGVLIAGVQLTLFVIYPNKRKVKV